MDFAVGVAGRVLLATERGAGLGLGGAVQLGAEVTEQGPTLRLAPASGATDRMYLRCNDLFNISSHKMSFQGLLPLLDD